MKDGARDQYKLRLSIALFQPARAQAIKDAVQAIWPFEGWDHNSDFIGDRPGWYSIEALQEDRQSPTDVPDTFMGTWATGGTGSELADLFASKDTLGPSRWGEFFGMLQEAVWDANGGEFCFVDLWPTPRSRWAWMSLGDHYDRAYGIERPWDSED
jgi:hypothetical protein